MLEKLQEFNKEKGNDNDELRDFAARLSRQDIAAQLQQDTRSRETARSPNDEQLWRPRLRKLPRGASQTCGTLTRSERQEAHGA